MLLRLTTQGVLKLPQSCVGAKKCTKVVGFAVAVVVVPDLVNVGSIGSLCNVNFACIDEYLEVLFFISFPLGLYWRASAMVKRPC